MEDAINRLRQLVAYGKIFRVISGVDHEQYTHRRLLKDLVETLLYGVRVCVAITVLCALPGSAEFAEIARDVDMRKMFRVYRGIKDPIRLLVLTERASPLRIVCPVSCLGVNQAGSTFLNDGVPEVEEEKS